MGLSEQGGRVLRALADGRRFRAGAAGWSSGTLRAPRALVDELAAAGLVRVEGGDLAATEAGLARAAAGAARPARIVAERALPEAERPGGRRSVAVNLLESPLGWLRARGLVDERQYDGGERLRADWTAAGLSPRITMRWDAGPRAARAGAPGGPIDPTLAGIAARRRFDGAVAAAGKGLDDILWRVVCAGEGLEAAETALGWPRRSGKLVLTLALDRVADFYGIA